MEKTASEIFANNNFSLWNCIYQFCKANSLSRYIELHSLFPEYSIHLSLYVAGIFYFLFPLIPHRLPSGLMMSFRKTESGRCNDKTISLICRKTRNCGAEKSHILLIRVALSRYLFLLLCYSECLYCSLIN
jgi:hypothetical protein